MSHKQIFDLVYYRPSEPTFVPKGNRDVQTRLDLPESFIDDRYRDVAAQIASIGDKSKVRLAKIDAKNFQKPDIEFAVKALSRRSQFSIFIPHHRKIASRLIKLFLDCPTVTDLANLAVFCRDLLNPNLFIYALSVTILNRADAHDFLFPNNTELFPDKYVDGRVFHRARQELATVPEGSRLPINIEPVDTASNVNHEDRVAYWREDLGLNYNYASFHLLYPTDAPELDIVAKDRRGELFYYHHQQLLARYNSERLSNRLFRVVPLNSLREPIGEGYFPKLSSQNSSTTWPPRCDDSELFDVRRTKERVFVSVDKLERWGERIIDAVDLGYVVGKNDINVPLNNEFGIDCLGNIIQSNELSPNRQYYGDLCHLGHMTIAFCHDPENRYLESFGVMGEPATSLRDPVFYRWHAYLNRIFRMHKRRLGSYSEKELYHGGVKIKSVEIRFQNKVDGTIRNTLQTFWQESDVELSRGLDFSPKGTVYVRLTHLQHHPFTYKINVENSGGALTKGTVRIYLAPKCDERDRPLTFEEQRHLMIEMDRFTVDLESGENVIIRRSEASSVTIDYDSTFNPETHRRKFEKGLIDRSTICKCGLPQYLLVPKGSINGHQFVLFVMISNYDDDKVEGEDQSKLKGCIEGSSYCGLPGQKYPDARPMGFPFDRPAADHVEYLEDFLFENMIAQDVVVKFLNKTVSSVDQGTGDAAAQSGLQ